MYVNAIKIDEAALNVEFYQQFLSNFYELDISLNVIKF